MTVKDSDQSDHLREDTFKGLARYNISNWQVETVVPTVDEAAEICKLSSQGRRTWLAYRSPPRRS